MLRILCFKCGHENLAANDVLGQTVACAKCGHSFVADDDVTVFVEDSAKATTATAPAPPPPPVEPPPIVVVQSPPLAASTQRTAPSRSSPPRRSIYKQLIVIATVLWLPACGFVYLARHLWLAANYYSTNGGLYYRDIHGEFITAVEYMWMERGAIDAVKMVTAAYAATMIVLLALHFATRPDR